jgi:hypothetical protein
LVEQLWLAVQAPQFPLPSQTMLVPQLVPPILLPPSTHITLPLLQELVPFRHVVGLPVQEVPAVQATQEPEPLQTMLVPQLVPGALSPPSVQVMLPALHEVVPFLHAVGLPVQDWPAVQATQAPEPLQTMLVPQLTPGALLVSSRQVDAPLAHDVRPFLQALGLAVQEIPAVHDTQAPEPLQTMLVPQLVPAILAVPFTHVADPVEHDAMPLKQIPGLPEQLAPAVHVPQNPLPSQTWFDPHDVPAMTFVAPSTQAMAPVAQEVVPFLHGDGLPVQDCPAVQATQLPAPLQTMLVPQEVPPAFGVLSMQVWTPVAQEVMPFLHAAPGFVVHGWPLAQTMHWPLALQTEFVPQPVPGGRAVPSTHAWTPVMHDDTPA